MHVVATPATVTDAFANNKSCSARGINVGCSQREDGQHSFADMQRVRRSLVSDKI